jgi:hypothetical protein
MENSTNPENECITYSEKSEKNYDALNTLQLISGKWKILIMKSIAESCPKRFGNFGKIWTLCLREHLLPNYENWKRTDLYAGKYMQKYHPK